MRPEKKIRWTLPNGLTVLYQHSPGIPLAAASVLTRSGSLYEKPFQAGLANLAWELLLSGTRRRSAREIAEVTESMGSSLGVQASEDYSEIGFVAPVDQLELVLDVVMDILMNPTFPLTEIKKERASVLAGLKSRQDTIFNRAYDCFNATFFGSHPYGRPVEGTERAVRRFTRSHLQTWHREHCRPDRTIFSLVSSWPLSKAKPILEKYGRRWTKASVSFPISPGPRVIPPSHSKRIRLQARFEQAYLMTGVLAPPALDASYLALKVLNTVLGGGMSSRLFIKLREETGLAYEVSSFFPTHLLPSQWVIYLGLPSDKLDVAREKLEDILRTLQDRGPSSEEVQQAIRMIQGAYLMELQGRRRQAWYAAWWEFLGKGNGFETDFLKALENVTPDQVRDLARQLLSQPRVTVEITPHAK